MLGPRGLLSLPSLPMDPRCSAPPTLETEMSLLPALSLFSRLAGRRGVVREPEPADMGTAFGMEQWLDEADEEAAPAQPRARRAWWPRWLARADAR